MKRGKFDGIIKFYTPRKKHNWWYGPKTVDLNSQGMPNMIAIEAAAYGQSRGYIFCLCALSFKQKQSWKTWSFKEPIGGD